MKQKSLVPKRRFEGFTEEWELRTLDNLGLFGKTHAFSRAMEGAGEYYHIHYGDIHVNYNGIINKATELPSIKVEGNFEVLKDDDIVIADASEDYVDLGKTVVIEETNQRKIIAGLHTFKFTPNTDLNSIFYLYYSQSIFFKEYSYKMGTGISVFGISKENMRKLQFSIPFEEEQQRIGQFFKHLDEMITLQQKKVDKTKALKSAYLAEMFPAEGESVPKRRFEGYIDNWEKHKLEDLAEIRTGKAFSSPDFLQSGKYLVVTNKNIQDQANGIETGGDRINLSDEAVLNNYLLCGDNILVTMDGVNIGKTGKYSDDKGVLAQRVGRINSEQLEFVYQVTRNIKFISKMHRLSVGNAIKHISLKQIAEYSFMAPKSNIEQQQIGEFFKKLDNTITNHQRKLDKLKATKQAYLHEMFV